MITCVFCHRVSLTLMKMGHFTYSSTAQSFAANQEIKSFISPSSDLETLFRMWIFMLTCIAVNICVLRLFIFKQNIIKICTENWCIKISLLHLTVLVKSLLLYITATWWFFTNYATICCFATNSQTLRLRSTELPSSYFTSNTATTWNWKTWFHYPQLYLKK